MKRILFPLILASLLIPTALLAQGSFNYPSPTVTLTGLSSGQITIFVFPPGPGIKTLDCPSTGVLGKFCDEIDTGDTAGFEGTLPSDLEVAVIDQGYAFPEPAWSFEDDCIDAITVDGDFHILEVDGEDLYCDETKGVLGRICPELEVDDCASFYGTTFPSDHDHAHERKLVVIRAEE